MGTKCLSLVELKKQQWAREKEELARLCGPWGNSQNCRDEFRPSIRTRFASTSQINLTVPENTSNTGSSSTVFRRRSPSLPPIHNGQKKEIEVLRSDQYSPQDNDGECETSGYASDSGGNEAWNLRHDNWIKEARKYGREGAWILQRDYGTPDSMISTPGRLWSYSTADEASRLKWGDRGIGVGHLWEPTLNEPESRLPQVQGGPPSWLERGLNKMSQVLVINHSPEQYDRQTTASTTCTDTTFNKSVKSECTRSYLLGQNIHVEPDILFEREQKRQKALELQNAIRLQMEEREKKRKDEKERMKREEQLEEERIRREQQLEQQRFEEEQRRQREKEEKEARKARVMREALETAQRMAKENNRKNSKHSDYTERNNTPAVCAPENIKEHFIANTVHEQVNSCHRKEISRTSDSTQTDVVSEGLSSLTNSCNVLPTSQGNVQLALLVAPSSVATGLRHHFLLPSSSDTETWLFNQRKQCFIAARECGTQTEDLIRKSETFSDRKMCANSHKNCKLPLRCHSQAQTPRKIEERPKWGVNQPVSQYVKQSERDPFYQKRISQRQHRRSVNDHPRSPEKRKHERKSSEERRVQVIVPSPSHAMKQGPEEIKMPTVTEHLALKGRRMYNGSEHERVRQWPVKDILSQLSSLKQGLLLKQREWQPSRSQTPYSDFS